MFMLIVILPAKRQLPVDCNVRLPDLKEFRISRLSISVAKHPIGTPQMRGLEVGHS